MRIYESATGWVVWTGTNKLSFATESEARNMATKLELAKSIIYQAQLHAKIMDENPDVLQEYFDLGESFVDADVESLGVTAAQVNSCLALLENAGKFYSGGSPTNAVYRVTVNSVRRVDLDS